jgi:tetratricopeptide (TPR) repeat protein
MEDGMEKDTRSEAAKVIPLVQTSEYFFDRGIKAYKRGNVKKAKRYIERVLQLEPENTVVLCQLAVILTDLGDYQQSNELLQSALQNANQESAYECHYFMANNYAYLGFFQEAKKHALQYINNEKNGRFSQAVEDLLEILSIEMDDIDEEENENEDRLIMQQEKAKLLLEMAQFEEAKELLHEIIEEHPEFWAAYNNLALAHFYTGEYEQAMIYVRKVLESNPGNLHALCNEAVFYFKTGKQDLLERQLTKLRVVHPISFDHRYKLGVTFAVIGEYSGAYRWLYSLYKKGAARDTTFLYWLSYSAYYIGHENLAKQAWEKLLVSSPEKKGEEPWNIAASTDGIQEVLHYIKQGEKEQFFGLYLLAQMDNEERKTLLTKETEHFLYSPFLKTLSQDMLKSEELPRCLQIALTMRKSLQSEEEEKGIVYWYTLYNKARFTESEMKNISAFAASVVYMFYQNLKRPVPQKKIAQEYGISLTTMSKYIKKIRSVSIVSV